MVSGSCVERKQRHSNCICFLSAPGQEQAALVSATLRQPTGLNYLNSETPPAQITQAISEAAPLLATSFEHMQAAFNAGPAEMSQYPDQQQREPEQCRQRDIHTQKTTETS